MYMDVLRVVETIQNHTFRDEHDENTRHAEQVLMEITRPDKTGSTQEGTKQKQNDRRHWRARRNRTPKRRSPVEGPYATGELPHIPNEHLYPQDHEGQRIRQMRPT
jgi:hypothetical protein